MLSRRETHQPCPKAKNFGGLGASPPSSPNAKRPRQLTHRHGAPFLRHLLAQLRTNQLSVATVAEQLQISRRRCYELYQDYLRACASRRQAQWTPGASGGNHRPAWISAVTQLLRKLLSARPAAADSFAASEVPRRLGIRLARAQVRRWAQQHDLAVPAHPPRPKAVVKRWQRQALGELWQLDASPHPWFPGSSIHYPLLDLIDDCSRLVTGAKLLGAGRAPGLFRSLAGRLRPARPPPVPLRGLSPLLPGPAPRRPHPNWAGL